MKPTIGRIVVYNTTEKERLLMDVENCNLQKQLPAVVVSVWSETCVNLKVLLDGPRGYLWVASVQQGDDERNWNWPQREA